MTNPTDQQFTAMQLRLARHGYELHEARSGWTVTGSNVQIKTQFWERVRGLAHQLENKESK
ncbi:MAG: hypothetical protein E6Q94_05685 [Burkholderiaceae bacterium]|nr:MAG: hypothetical protein E6Q94_05685 [Burkholderiaceae bacterium]